MSVAQTDVYQTFTSRQSLEQALTRLTETLGAHGFGVLWDLDVNATLQKKGLDLHNRFHILEVCSAPRAKEALEQNPLTAYFLPCKVTVYQADGQTRIGLPRPTALIGLVGDDSLRALAEEVEGVLVSAIGEAVGD